jgi:DNA-directed RNA polymerase specialized sigma24 family protein
MDEPARIAGMTEQDRQISEIVAEQRSRLRNFIRRRVPNPSDAEDIVQEVFYELVEANHLLMPIEHLTGWLFEWRATASLTFFARRSQRPSATQRWRAKARCCCTSKTFAIA